MKKTYIQMIVEYGLQCYRCDRKLLVLHAVRNVNVEGFSNLLCWSYRSSSWGLFWRESTTTNLLRQLLVLIYHNQDFRLSTTWIETVLWTEPGAGNLVGALQKRTLKDAEHSCRSPPSSVFSGRNWIFPIATLWSLPSRHDVW